MDDVRLTLTQAVKDPSRRVQLEALRDYLAAQLEGHLCKTCENSRLRTGDQAALVLRLQKVMEELDALPVPNTDKSGLDMLRDQTNVVAFDRTDTSRKSMPRANDGRPNRVQKKRDA